MKKKLSKRMRNTLNLIDGSIHYNIMDGLTLLKKLSVSKFIESVDVAVNLGINTRKSDQNIRNSVIMPYGIGRDLRVAVFTQGANVELAKKAGAELVGLESLFDHIQTNGCNDFDIILASPDVMHIVGRLGAILGPKGLMPNPRLGTVSQNVFESVRNIKLGQIRYKNDKNGIVHVVIGKIDFELTYLQKNLETFIISLQQVRPVQCKGNYIKKISVSTTMGRSVVIDKNSLAMPIY